MTLRQDAPLPDRWHRVHKPHDPECPYIVCKCPPRQDAPASDGPATEARTIATMRLREALDMERQTSEGNAMTPLRVAGFISGPWLDYIAAPYLTEAARIPCSNERCTPASDGPATEAGRALLARGTDDISMFEHEWRETILAIEAEAAAGSRSEALDVGPLGQAMEQRGIRVSRADAEDIARRYAALSGASSSESEP